MNTEHLENELVAVAWVIETMRHTGNTHLPKYAELIERSHVLRELVKVKEMAA